VIGCPHDVVVRRSDALPLFGEDSMPMDLWECGACEWRFWPRRRTWQERLREWWEVKKLSWMFDRT
jgi:hypothetical protein